jgi:hypothetical protein
VSPTVAKPSRTVFTWRNCSIEKDKRVKLISKTPLPKLIYAAVIGYKSVCEFELGLVPSEAIEEKKSEAVIAPTNPVAAPTLSQPCQLCATCGQMVPTRVFTNHSAFCARNNWKCSQCGEIMLKKLKDTHFHCSVCNAVGPSKDFHFHCSMCSATGPTKDFHFHCPTCNEIIVPAEKSKHDDLMHRDIVCDCGKKVEPRRFQNHKETECPMRLVDCKYCTVKVTAKEKDSHQAFCGGKSIPCGLCGKEVAAKRMDIHLAVDHNINVSLKDKEDFMPKAHNSATDKTESDDLAKALAMSLGGTFIVFMVLFFLV